jgi:hypothetical protein
MGFDDIVYVKYGSLNKKHSEILIKNFITLKKEG